MELWPADSPTTKVAPVCACGLAERLPWMRVAVRAVSWKAEPTAPAPAAPVTAALAVWRYGPSLGAWSESSTSAPLVTEAVARTDRSCVIRAICAEAMGAKAARTAVMASERTGMCGLLDPIERERLARGGSDASVRASFMPGESWRGAWG